MSSRLMPPKLGAKPHHRLDNLVDVCGVEDDRNRVDASEVFEQQRLAFHHRQGSERPDVAETKHGSAIRNDGDDIGDRQVKVSASPGSAAIASLTRATPGV